jgi:uncharacterized membrane protein
MFSFGLIIGLLIILVAILIATLARPLNLNKNFYIKLCFILLLLTVFSDLLSYLTSISILGFIGSFSFFFTFAFVILHSSKVLGNRKTAIFFIFAFLFGLLSEINSIQIGLFYYTIPTFFFGLVPFTIPFLWVIIIYLSYTLTNLFLFGFGGEKPKRTDKPWYLTGLILLTSSISGLIAVNLDMIADPVSVSPQAAQWVWIVGGPYFGIPISNFIGWFLVTAGTVLIFRSYEAFETQPKDDPQLDTKLYLYIIIIYLIYFLFNAIKAFTLGKVEYTLIGTATMVPFILIGLLALLFNRKNRIERFKP